MGGTTDHEGAARGIHSQVLSGQTANDAHLSERFLVDLLERVVLALEPQHHDSAAVGADENEVGVVSYVSHPFGEEYPTGGTVSGRG